MATVHRIHSGRSGPFQEKLPTSTCTVPKGPTTIYMTHLRLLSRLCCVRKEETGSPLKLGSLELRTTLIPTFIISKAVVRMCVCVCVVARVSFHTGNNFVKDNLVLSALAHALTHSHTGGKASLQSPAGQTPHAIHHASAVQ